MSWIHWLFLTPLLQMVRFNMIFLANICQTDDDVIKVQNAMNRVAGVQKTFCKTCISKSKKISLIACFLSS